jgi:hypothetical protein
MLVVARMLVSLTIILHATVTIFHQKIFVHGRTFLYPLDYNDILDNYLFRNVNQHLRMRSLLLMMEARTQQQRYEC